MTITFSWAAWPQMVIAAIMIIAVLVNVVKHGQPYPDDWKFNAVSKLIAVMIWSWLLHEGGFW